MINVNWTDDLCSITINRPTKANALTEAMLLDLTRAFEQAAVANAVILTGHGKVFSAGADLGAAAQGLAVSPQWEHLSSAVAECSGLTIAALNGTVAGGSLGMVLACDMRVAVPSAKFFYPVMKLGFLPQSSDPVRMRALIGPARTKAIFMAGKRIDAVTAEAWGLVDEVADDVISAVHALCADALAASQSHVSGIKALI